MIVRVLGKAFLACGAVAAQYRLVFGFEIAFRFTWTVVMLGANVSGECEVIMSTAIG